MSKAFDLYRKAWDWYTEPKYRRDPKWLETENGFERTGNLVAYRSNNGLTMFDQLEIEDRICPRSWKNPPAWGWMVHWWMEKNGPQATRRKIRWFWQRGKRGYSDRDVWGLNTHLARVIADSVEQLRENAHGYPGPNNGVNTPEEWDDILGKIAKGFRDTALLEGMYDPHDPEYIKILNNLTTAGRLLTDHWQSLWD